MPQQILAEVRDGMEKGMLVDASTWKAAPLRTRGQRGGSSTLVR